MWGMGGKGLEYVELTSRAIVVMGSIHCIMRTKRLRFINGDGGWRMMYDGADQVGGQAWPSFSLILRRRYLVRTMMEPSAVQMSYRI